jgi:carbon-monoxide dehydrogenase large subunit
MAFCAMQTGRPVKWVETRRENFLCTTHGRDHVTDVEAAYTNEGKILGLKFKAWANMGAYVSTAAPGVPTWLYGLMLSGVYDVAAVGAEVVGVFTHTTPVDACRGAGRPEATYLLERAVDLMAQRLDMDPVEIRRRNFIGKEKFPHQVATGVSYDSGDYDAALDRCLEMVDYEAFRSEQAEARKQGRYLGIGFSTYVEICGLGPSAVVGSTGFQGGLWESSVVRVHPTGKVTVMTGANPHGQGEETTFAQVVGDVLGVDIDDVELVHGDTDLVPMGMGTYGSRATAVGGIAAFKAAEKVVDKARKIAAHQLEAREEDLEFEDGRFQVSGTDQGMSFQDVALQAYLAWNLPEGMEPGLESQSFYDPSNFVFPFGAHACIVEVDAETGQTKIVRYVAVDDCGKVINPLIVDGQIHGGIAFGIAQALYEHAQYDESAQLLTGTMMDYAVPKPGQMPSFELDRTVTPSPVNPLGLKGIGEAGSIGSTAAVANAVADALGPFGIDHVEMPFTPQRVWQAIQQAQGR